MIRHAALRWRSSARNSAPEANAATWKPYTSSNAVNESQIHSSSSTTQTDSMVSVLVKRSGSLVAAGGMGAMPETTWISGFGRTFAATGQVGSMADPLGLAGHFECASVAELDPMRIGYGDATLPLDARNTRA